MSTYEFWVALGLIPVTVAFTWILFNKVARACLLGAWFVRVCGCLFASALAWVLTRPTGQTLTPAILKTYFGFCTLLALIFVVHVSACMHLCYSVCRHSSHAVVDVLG